jgi:hypothetical protein
VCSDRDLRVVYQPEDMTDGKNPENDARDAQSSSLRVHGPIFVGPFLICQQKMRGYV